MRTAAHVSAAGQAGEQPIVRLDRVSKTFGGMAALRGLSLDIHRGEFLTLLGPSGCGKTTTLRLINGFEVPDSGTVSIADRLANGTPPYQRDVNTVFQSYALFPHLSVRDNVAYGLVVKKRPKQEIVRRVGEMLERVALHDKAQRFPRELSGGQMQRVALARALINEPQVLLLDEPLGALYTKLRRSMHIELRRMHRELGITFVCVTHDQEEALVMSDRIAVMKDGDIAQIGTPQRIYQHPQSRFVADFIGGCNFLKARRQSDGILLLPDGTRLPTEIRGKAQEVTIAVRPAKIVMGNQQDSSFPADIKDVAYLGDSCRVMLTCFGNVDLIAECDARSASEKAIVPGNRTSLTIAARDLIILEESEGAAS